MADLDPSAVAADIQGRLERGTPEMRALFDVLIDAGLPPTVALQRAGNIATYLIGAAGDELESIEQGLRVESEKVVRALAERCLGAVRHVQRKGG